jgi:hypothetical protein
MASGSARLAHSRRLQRRKALGKGGQLHTCQRVTLQRLAIRQAAGFAAACSRACLRLLRNGQGFGHGTSLHYSGWRLLGAGWLLPLPPPCCFLC